MLIIFTNFQNFFRDYLLSIQLYSIQFSQRGVKKVRQNFYYIYNIYIIYIINFIYLQFVTSDECGS